MSVSISLSQKALRTYPAIGGWHAESQQRRFDLYNKEVDNCVNNQLVLPAYDYVLKCSHTFNLLDARGVISKDERINFINRIRTMAAAVARLYVEQRENLGFPLCKLEKAVT